MMDTFPHSRDWAVQVLGKGATGNVRGTSVRVRAVRGTHGLMCVRCVRVGCGSGAGAVHVRVCVRGACNTPGYPCGLLIHKIRLEEL